MEEMGPGPIYFANYLADKGSFMLKYEALSTIIAWEAEENTLYHTALALRGCYFRLSNLWLKLNKSPRPN